MENIVTFFEARSHFDKDMYFNSLRFRINHSLIVDFEKQGPSVLNKKDNDKQTDSMILGSLVDCLLLTPGEFSKSFNIITEEDKLTPSQEKLLNYFNNLAIRRLPSDESTITYIMETCRREKIYNSYSDKTLREKVLEMLPKLNKKFLTMHATDITPETYEHAKAIVEQLKSSNISKKIFDGTYLMFPQVGLTTTNLKALFDIILIDTENKKVIPIDLKTTSSPELEFIKGPFLKFKYYRQAELYMKLLKEAVDRCNRDSEEEYTIEPFKFLVVNTTNPNPLLYNFNINYNDEGKLILNKYNYTAEPIDSIIDLILWHREKQEYRYPKEIAENLYKNLNNKELTYINITD